MSFRVLTESNTENCNKFSNEYGTYIYHKNWSDLLLEEYDRASCQNLTESYIPNKLIQKYKQLPEPKTINELVDKYNKKFYLVEGYYKTYDDDTILNAIKKLISKYNFVSVEKEIIEDTLDIHTQTINFLLQHNVKTYCTYTFKIEYSRNNDVAFTEIKRLMQLAGYYIEAVINENNYKYIVYAPRYQKIIDYSYVEYFVHITKTEVYGKIIVNGIKPSNDELFDISMISNSNNVFMHPGRVYLFPILKESCFSNKSRYTQYIINAKKLIQTFIAQKYHRFRYSYIHIKIPKNTINLYADPMLEGAVWTYDYIRPEWIGINNCKCYY